MNSLKVEHIDVFYGDVQAVWDVSFQVAEGEIVTLVGANGAGKTTTLRTLAAVLQMFPILEKRLSQNAGTLSGGEQQMCAIGRGLMARPRLLMLDEPALGLAPMLVRQVFSALKDINARGVTVLLVEQNVQHALRLAHRAYVLETGRVTLEGTSAALLDDP